MEEIEEANMDFSPEQVSSVSSSIVQYFYYQLKQLEKVAKGAGRAGSAEGVSRGGKQFFYCRMLKL